MAVKRFYEIGPFEGPTSEGIPRILLAVADDEADVRSIAEVRAAGLTEIMEVPGTVVTDGPSRVVGWTRLARPRLARGRHESAA